MVRHPLFGQHADGLSNTPIRLLPVPDEGGGSKGYNYGRHLSLRLALRVNSGTCCDYPYDIPPDSHLASLLTIRMRVKCKIERN